MRKSDLDFWQGMAAHYSKFMRRSAPIYAEICNHIRPHLTRDMNVLELACGTGEDMRLHHRIRANRHSSRTKRHSFRVNHHRIRETLIRLIRLCQLAVQ